MRDFVYFDNYLNNVLTRLNKRQISFRTRQNAESQKTRSHTYAILRRNSNLEYKESHTFCTRLIQNADKFNRGRHWIWLLNFVWSILMWFVSLNMIWNWHTKSNANTRYRSFFFLLVPFEFINLLNLNQLTMWKQW